MENPGLPRVADFYQSELLIPRLGSRSKTKWVNAGLCPFHDDHNAGNFFIHLPSGAFVCHACKAKGNSIIKFRMLREKISYGEARENILHEWR